MVEHLSSEQKVAGSSPVLSMFLVKLCVFQPGLNHMQSRFLPIFFRTNKKARKNGMEDGILFSSYKFGY